MSEEYKRDKTKSMVDLCVAISIANENCEGENWGDAINLCGEADILIKQYEATIADLESRLADLHESWKSMEEYSNRQASRIRTLESELTELEAELAKYQGIVRDLRKAFVGMSYKASVSRIDDLLEKKHLTLPESESA